MHIDHHAVSVHTEDRYAVSVNGLVCRILNVHQFTTARVTAMVNGTGQPCLEFLPIVLDQFTPHCPPQASRNVVNMTKAASY